MALSKQVGIQFKLREDWKALFQKDTWFIWQRVFSADKVILKRFTLWNVFRWYFFQVVLKIVVAMLYPTLRLAYLYWNDIEEGKDSRVVAEIFLKEMPKVRFFRLGKEK